jgi:glycosyltransferase involved in cell wall biosynthesis
MTGAQPALLPPARGATRPLGRAVVAPAPAGPPATIVHVTTVPVTLHFLTGQAPFVRRFGFSVEAVSSPGPDLSAFAGREGVPVHAIPMTRRITPLQDLVGLWRMCRALRRIRPKIVHAHTPKGGLLGMIAAWLTRTQARIYTMHGSPLLTAVGVRRRLLRWSERTSCRLAHRVLAVSESMRNIAIREGLCEADKIKVLLGGSANGVDARCRFRPPGKAGRRAAREECGIPPEALVVGFVGRLVREKGIVELATAWERLREEDGGLHLLLVGALEGEDALPPEVVQALRSDGRVRLTGHVSDTARLYAAMDVVALPTFREGFPVVALEAAATALPIVATTVPGCLEAVQDGVTGMLVPPRDPVALAAALRRYLEDSSLRARHGEAARRRVLAEFRPEAMWEAILSEYRSLLPPRPATP